MHNKFVCITAEEIINSVILEAILDNEHARNYLKVGEKRETSTMILSKKDDVWLVTGK